MYQNASQFLRLAVQRPGFSILSAAMAVHEMSYQVEGIVFHHQDGRKAKIKKRDFGLKRSE